MKIAGLLVNGGGSMKGSQYKIMFRPPPALPAQLGDNGKTTAFDNSR
jgi:hypothetical protein